jgi:hypothetical protein
VVIAQRLYVQDARQGIIVECHGDDRDWLVLHRWLTFLLSATTNKDTFDDSLDLIILDYSTYTTLSLSMASSSTNSNNPIGVLTNSDQMLLLSCLRHMEGGIPTWTSELCTPLS